MAKFSGAPPSCRALRCPVMFAFAGSLRCTFSGAAAALSRADEKRDLIAVAVQISFAVAFALWRIAMARYYGAPELGETSYDCPRSCAGRLDSVYPLMAQPRYTQQQLMVVCCVAVGPRLRHHGYMARDVWNYVGSARVLTRNFYGALVVYDQAAENDMGPYRELRHGTIEHGEQFLWPQNLRHATTYYAEKSGLGLALRSLRVEGNLNVGSIGLGAGTTAVYARPGDHYYFYDINPNVPIIATTQFSFLLHCYGKHEIILGDARLSLENELKQGINRRFDLLSVDAFSGDAIPVHLLTREAYKIYWQHLLPNGVLAVHVSNRYLSLAPGVALAAAEAGQAGHGDQFRWR